MTNSKADAGNKVKSKHGWGNPFVKLAREMERKLRTERSIKDYLDNPKICLGCGKAIPIPGNGKFVCRARAKKFCNWECRNRYSNRIGLDRINRKLRLHSRSFGFCNVCGLKIEYDRRPSGGFQRYSRCLEHRPNHLKREGAHDKPLSRETISKLRAKTPELQAQRAAIKLQSRAIFMASGRKRECFVCGYSSHIDVCHIKAVADFEDSATVGEINAQENLIALCKNHHWEFDHGDLKICLDSKEYLK